MLFNLLFTLEVASPLLEKRGLYFGGNIFLIIFLAFRLLRGHSFFHPCHNGQWPPTSKDFLYQILSITLFSYFNSWERARGSIKDLVVIWIFCVTESMGKYDPTEEPDLSGEISTPSTPTSEPTSILRKRRVTEGGKH